MSLVQYTHSVLNTCFGLTPDSTSLVELVLQ
jgi:hypothetical protein